jgi:hypothetical protein
MPRLKPHHRVYLAALLLDCALMAGFTAMPFFIFDHLGGGAGKSGMLAGLQSIGYAALSLLSARYISGPRNGMTWACVGTVLYGIFSSGCVLASSYYAFAAASMIGFVSLALVWPAQWSWLGAEPDPAKRVRRISHYNVSWSIGLMMGPLAAGPLYAIDYRLPFLLVFVLSAAALWLQFGVPREESLHATPAALPTETGTRCPAIVQFLYVSWFANFVGWILLGAARSVFPKRVADLADSAQLVWITGDTASAQFLMHGALAFSWLSFIINGARLVVFGLMGVTSRWQGKIGPILATQGIAAAACWILSWTRSYIVMALCCTAIGVCGGVSFFYSAFYSLADPRKKHRRAAVNEAIVGTGGFTGAVGFGLLASYYGVAMPFEWTPLIILAGFAIQYALLMYGRHQARTSLR